MFRNLSLIVLVLALYKEVNGEGKNNPDTFLDVPAMIVYDGYPQETHIVVTEDGYALTVHRIPHGRDKGNSTGCDKAAVVLVHGLFGSSAYWLFTGVDSALSYMLADRGYDVWMFNARGNLYSTKYTPERDPRTKEFWDFSWHESGVYDLPAVIDYILEMTGKEKIFYVGHSMGNAIFYVMMSQRPEYNDKVTAMISLAPIAYMNEERTGPLSVSIDLFDEFGTFLNVIGFTQIKPVPHVLSNIALTLCLKMPVISYFCQKLLAVFGENVKHLNPATIPVYFNHKFAGSSTRGLLHYVQLLQSGCFCQYDYGESDNINHYHSSGPPCYDISSTTAPVALFYGDGDNISNEIVVTQLYEELPNVVKLYKVPLKGFEHTDFITHKDIATLVNKPIIDIFDLYCTH